MDALLSGVLAQGEFFKEQVSTNIYLLDVFYGLATVSLFLVVVAVGLIDTGLVQRKNVLEIWIGKMMSAMIAGLGLAIIGFGIWNAQFYEAVGVPTPWGQAIEDWWLGGTKTETYAQFLDPATAFENDVFQVFFAFFVAYAMVGGALLHSAGLERVKAVPMYIICFVAGAIVIPILLYLTWGSTSPLTKNGLHDYVGVYALYIVVGVWALIIAWRAGPRIGTFADKEGHPTSRAIQLDADAPGPGVLGHRPHNLSMTALGVGLLLFCVPFLALGCGYIVPDVGYFGISLTTSGFGVVLINIFISFCGGALMGAIISYVTKNPIMVLLGPVAGYIGCAAAFDVGKPIEMLLVSFLAPLPVYGTYLLLLRMRIDDKKIVPLTLGGGIYAVIAAGIVGAGDKTGGYFGITEGEYTFQGAEISIGDQLLGLLVTLGISAVSGLVLILLLEKTIGLRVKEHDELAGLDHSFWGSGPVDEATLLAEGVDTGAGRPTASV
jgi:ammonium transporter, Amt family